MPPMKPAERHVEIGRSLFREANDAFFLFDPHNQMIVDLNPTALRLTGLDKDAACSMRLDDLFSGSNPGGLEGLTQALARTGFFHSREGYFLKRASKADLPVNLSVSRIHTEPQPVGLVVARDISERKKAEEALKQIETRYNSLIASTGVMVWEIDAAGTLISISPAFQTDLRMVVRRVGHPALRGPVAPGRSRIGDPDARASVRRRDDSPATSFAFKPRPVKASTAKLLLVTRIPDGDYRARPGRHPRYHRREAECNGPMSRPRSCGGPRKKPNEPIGPRASSCRA